MLNFPLAAPSENISSKLSPTCAKDVVDECHSIALKNGAINEGSPGLREGYENVYYSYIRDLDKNKICVYADVN